MEDTMKQIMILKAMADDTRLKIVEMLSCGELCACDILEYFHITQPTLSYHMKILTDSGIVISRKEGSWVRYRNNEEALADFRRYLERITTAQEDCICKSNRISTCDESEANKLKETNYE